MKSVLSTLLILIACSLTHAQLSDQQLSEIDKIYEDWDTKESAGAALGIIMDGKLVYSKGYGMANLEYDIPISNQSVFRIGSTSKQFTAACIVLLSEQGKLSLDDKLSKYFPELPEYAARITIQYLLNHTSGIRDYLTLTYLKGMRDDDYYEDDEVLRLLSEQDDINFGPNDEYLYSNSGYWLLGQIVEKASGMNMAEYADDQIFKPLGMTNTHFHNDFKRIVKNRASGYNPLGDGEFEISMTTLNMIGDGGIFTSIDDMKIWDDAFYQSEVLSPDFWKTMTKRGVLNNGDTITYASGLTVSEYKGLSVIAHGGAFVGFRANLVRFPKQKTTILQFANRSDGNPNRAYQVADVIFKDKMTISNEDDVQSSVKKPKKVKVSTKLLKDIEGDYWNEASGYSRKIYSRNDTLWYQRTESNKSALMPISKNSFIMMGVNVNLVVEFNLNSDTKKMIVTIDNNKPIESYSYIPIDGNIEDFKSFIGTYYSVELDVTYELKIMEAKLTLFINGKERSNLEPIMVNLFNADFGLFDFRNTDKNGFLLQAGRVKNLKFAKK